MTMTDPPETLESSTGAKHYSDCTQLPTLTDDALLANTIARSAAKLPYTFTGTRILLSVNPCEPIPALYDEPAMRAALETGPLALAQNTMGVAPHLFTAAETAYANLFEERTSVRNQSIVVSGVSGAGKTEATKLVTQYLCWRAAGGAMDEAGKEVIECLSASSDVLEAFGNCATSNNGNSSRFGKFTRASFSHGGMLQSAVVSCFLLEKSRLTTASAESGDSTFHILHQLAAHARHSNGRRDDAHRYVVSAAPSAASAHLDRTEAAMQRLGIQSEEVFSLLSGMLHLGDITFEAKDKPTSAVAIGDDEAVISAGCGKEILQAAEELLGIEGLEMALTRKLVKAAQGIETVSSPLKPETAARTRDGVCKAIYVRLFDWVVSKINEALRGGGKEGGDEKASSQDATRGWIGMLDVFGFEVFETNSLEQLCINYANEKLQGFFLQSIFDGEQALYLEEKIPWASIAAPDNSHCIKALEDVPHGVLTLLTDTCRLDRDVVTDEMFCERLNIVNPSCMQAVAALDQKARAHFRPKQVFILEHFVQPVHYTAADFLEKNCDSTSAEIEAALAASRQPLMRELFSVCRAARGPSEDAAADAAWKGSAEGGAASFTSRTFALSLRQLMQSLEATAPFFIRCIKPNDELSPGYCTSALVHRQLRACGMLQATHMIRTMYPSRAAYDHIYSVYVGAAPRGLADLSPRAFVAAVCGAFDASPAEYQLGATRVFFTYDCPTYLTQLCQGAAVGTQGVLERSVLTWKLVLWQREHAVVCGLRRWLERATNTSRPTLESTESVQRYRALRREMVVASIRARAATRVQRRARGLHARAEYAAHLTARRRQRAATALQAAARGGAARRWCRRTFAEERAAAAALQAAVRRTRACRRYGALRAAARRIQAAARAYLARRHRAATRIQAAARRTLFRNLLPAAYSAACKLQAKWRSVRVRLLARGLATAVSELREGAVLWKYYEGGLRTEHQRRVWLSDDLDHLYWSKDLLPTGGTSAPKSIELATVSAVSDGVKTHCLKKIERGKEGILHGVADRFFGGATELKRDSCFSILAEAQGGKSRTLDLMADSTESRDRWLKNLRLLLVHRHTLNVVGSNGLMRLRAVVDTPPTIPDRDQIKALDNGRRALLMGMSTLDLPKGTKPNGFDRALSFRKAGDMLHAVSFGARSRTMSKARRPSTQVDAHGLPHAIS
ncbi:hypothetical protein AB1Y20_022130 [Prymnesium parvum]|uniref:Myosin motor domain-containing protein n=1 Tax=Prymnesium parvum TaxID=97485 RepID=A0AB34JIQ5_PRYPA